eukprot:SAG22_NODE_2370_length_2645_cov_7.031422_3_plen_145_part_00
MMEETSPKANAEAAGGGGGMANGTTGGGDGWAGGAPAVVAGKLKLNKEINLAKIVPRVIALEQLGQKTAASVDALRAEVADKAATNAAMEVGPERDAQVSCKALSSLVLSLELCLRRCLSVRSVWPSSSRACCTRLSRSSRPVR